MVTRYCGQWEKEVPSVEDLIGKSPFFVPEKSEIKKENTDIDTINKWKTWAKEKGLKYGGDK